MMVPTNNHVKHANGQKKPLRPGQSVESEAPTIPTPKKEKRPWRKHRTAALAPGQPNAHSKLTDALQSELCGLVMNKATLEDAADHLGLNRTTIWEWRDRGRADPESRYGAASLKGTEFTAKGLVGKLTYLCLMDCNRSQSEPVQCAVFVGSEAYIRAISDELQARVIESAKRLGTEALIVERSLCLPDGARLKTLFGAALLAKP